MQSRTGVPEALRTWSSRRRSDISFEPIGRTSETWLLRGEDGPLVAKQMSPMQHPEEYARTFNAVSQAGLGPQFIEAVPGPAEWYALFQYLPGNHPDATADGWDRLRPQVRSLLEGLAIVAELPRFNLIDHWVPLLTAYSFPEATATEFRQRLFQRLPADTTVLAHGDFSLQNLILASGRAILIDWSQAGRAPAGFDAGWLIAITKVGVPCGCSETQLVRDLADDNADSIQWFVHLGLLRLLWRAHTLPLNDFVRAALRARLLALIQNELQGR